VEKIVTMGEYDWKQVTGTIAASIVVALLGYLGGRLAERRRKIHFSVPRLYFGPALTANAFVGRNYPCDDLIELECDVKFFSDKSTQTGLHNFRFEFCRTSYFGRLVEFTVGPKGIYRDLLKKGSTITLDTLDLPPRQFISFELRTSFPRDKWLQLQQCDFVRLACETPEGSVKRFPVGQISFPDMPPPGVRGIEYCSVQMMPSHIPPDGRSVITAFRRPKTLGPPGKLPSAEDTRYWNGTTWVQSIKEARIYSDPQKAQSEGASIKIWDIVPEEWLTKE
jgi:hypothetical protein